MENDKIIIYQTDDGQTRIDVRMQDETVWLTQAQMAELFQKDRTVIGRHINNVFKEGELERELVCAKIAHTTRHGAIEGKTQRQEIVFYNLDVVISVGYRVKSKRGTAFRIWARNVIKDYLHAFKNIEFAVYCSPRDERNFKIFERVLKVYCG